MPNKCSEIGFWSPVKCPVFFRTAGIAAFSALTLLVGWQEEHPACKNWVVRCWCGYLSGTRCRLAYGPADATVSCFSKIQFGFAFLVPAHPGSPGKRAVKRVCMCVLGSLHWALQKRLNRSCMLFWTGQTHAGSWNHILYGVHIDATRRIRWNNLCGGGDAGCRYHYCSNLFCVACVVKCKGRPNLLMSKSKVTVKSRPYSYSIVCNERVMWHCLQYFDAVGWATGRASGL